MAATFGNEGEAKGIGRPTEMRINATEKLAYEKIADKNLLLGGYNCQNPTEIESHEVDSVGACENLSVKKKIETVEYQILQESEQFTNKAIYCLLKRTRRVGHCVAFHHTAAIYQEGYVVCSIKIEPEECKMM